MPLVIVGDAAYPLMPWLMKPFINNQRLDEEQKHFNYRQSRARMVVENAFGRLKGHWRVLLKRMEIGIKSVPNVISACCVLHNMCEIWGEVFQDEWLEEVPINNRIPRRRLVPRDAARDRLSKRIRELLKLGYKGIIKQHEVYRHNTNLFMHCFKRMKLASDI